MKYQVYIFLIHTFLLKETASQQGALIFRVHMKSISCFSRFCLDTRRQLFNSLLCTLCPHTQYYISEKEDEWGKSNRIGMPLQHSHGTLSHYMWTRCHAVCIEMGIVQQRLKIKLRNKTCLDSSLVKNKYSVCFLISFQSQFDMPQIGEVNGT